LAKPIVNGIEKKLAGQVPVIHIDVMSRTGSQIASRFGVRGVPTLLVVNGEGQSVLRQVGRLRQEPVLSALTDLRVPISIVE